MESLERAFFHVNVLVLVDWWSFRAFTTTQKNQLERGKKIFHNDIWRTCCLVTRYSLSHQNSVTTFHTHISSFQCVGYKNWLCYLSSLTSVYQGRFGAVFLFIIFFLFLPVPSSSSSSSSHHNNNRNHFPSQNHAVSFAAAAVYWVGQSKWLTDGQTDWLTDS